MDSTSKQLVVKLVKRKIGGLGFVVKKKPGSPWAVVTDIVKGSVAEESGLLQVGDAILEVNGVQVTELAFDRVLELLNGVSIGKEVILKVQAVSSSTHDPSLKPSLNGSVINGGVMIENEMPNGTNNTCPFSGFNPGHKNPKFVRLTNLITGKQITDTLHQKVTEVRTDIISFILPFLR